MNRLYSFFFIPFLWSIAIPECSVDFTYKQVSGVAKSDRSLELKLKEGASEEYTLELYDFNTGEVVSKKPVYFAPGDSKIVFDKIKPSTYTVYFSSASCPKKRSIKIEGGIVVQ